jgi:hypothetical protein
VLTSPHAAYGEIVASPQWLGALVVVLAATIAPTSWLLSTGIGQRAGIDQLLQTSEAFGRPVNDAEYQAIEGIAPYFAYLAAIFQMIFVPLVALVVAGIAFGVLRPRNSTVSFRQVFAVVVFSSVVTGLRAVLAAPLNYARESMSSPTNLTAVLPFFGDNTFAARLFGSIDLFVVWWTVSLAIGLGVLYRRRAAPIVAGLLGVYGASALTIALVRTVFAGA